jgi:signal transduction histidine kinase
MKFYQSIRFRVAVGILFFGILLMAINTGITFFVMGEGFSRMVSNLIDTEIDSFKYKYEKDKTTPLPHSKYINMYEGIDDVPERFKKLAATLPPGVHVIDEQTKRRPVHIGVIELPDKESPYFMFFHAREFFEENVHLRPKEILMMSIAILLIPGIIIGYITSKVLYAPMVQLMDQIKGLNPEDLPAKFPFKHSSNEIGRLTRTIEATMQRIKFFIQREKQFTRDASHELRTPLTIVKGAVEIMEQQPELETNPLLKKPLKRISRSINDMQTTIETFLWLAREDNEILESCRVEPVVRKAIADNKYLIEDKDINLHININNDKSVKVKEEILYIAVINLIRNAFHFTIKGSVTITVDDKYISIQDTGVGIEQGKLESVTKAHVKGEQSQGFGLGLSIVSRLCKRFGWELLIQSPQEQGTQVKIMWQDT